MLLLVITGISLIVLLSVPNHYIQLSYFGVNTKRQIERAKTIDEPKIVFIGGSHCAFGLCSPMISEHFNMPVCNTGVNYIFGLLAQLQLYEEYIKEGDIVVVMPEYQQFFGDVYLGNEEYLGLLTSVYPRGYRNLTFQQQVHLLPYVPRAFDAALKMRHKAPKENSPYSPVALNEFGDIEMYDLRKHIEDKDWTPDRFEYMDFQMGAIRALTDFDKYCKNHNAKLIILPPVYKSTSFNVNKESIDLVWDSLKKNGLPLASLPIHYCLADTLFYDSDSHLTYDGTMVRTHQVIEDMDEALVK